ncbi:hypothetical protein NPIL_628881 [Nephila pilipes]|uniref:WAP domain-containing protein n=1 Tax=Nephila pilipes TaxID=299642 RepID=A0A8X6UN56_NEPPI|nr:hypothetical protein NPIL_628881 [Nephila pilipes]
MEVDPENSVNLFAKEIFFKTYKMKPIAVLLLMLVVISAVQAANFCPRMPDYVCIQAVNECCEDLDCEDGEICCQENCGNKCREPVAERTNGEEVKPSSTCSIGQQ